MLLVPTKGSAGSRSVLVGGTPEFFSLGPFAAGSILRRVGVTVSLVGEVAVQVGEFDLAVASSADAVLANFLSGTPLVDSSNLLVSGRPVVTVAAIQSMAARYEFFPGWVFQTGSQWLLCRCINAGAAVGMQIFVSCEVWRVVRSLSDEVVPLGVT